MTDSQRIPSLADQIFTGHNQNKRKISGHWCWFHTSTVFDECPLLVPQGAERSGLSAGQSISKTFQGAIWKCTEDRAGVQQILHRYVCYQNINKPIIKKKIYDIDNTCLQNQLKSDLLFAGIVQGGTLPYICTQIMTIVDQEQSKVLWTPLGCP